MAKCILLGSGGSSIDEDVLTATPPKVIKSLTFLGAGSDEPQTGTLEINYANIAVGITILGKTGTYTGKGNAGPGQVLKGYTASSSSKSNFDGELPNKGLLNDTNANINYSKTLEAGYYSSIKVSQNLSVWESPTNSAGVITAYGGATNGRAIDDNTRGRGIAVRIQNNARLMGANWVFLAMPNLIPENIKNGVSIFGIQGTAKSPFPDEDVFLFNEGIWQGEASSGAYITCIQIDRNGETPHNEYVNNGNPVGPFGIANTRAGDGNLYTEGNDYNTARYCGYFGYNVYIYGYVEDGTNRFRDVDGNIRNLNLDPPGYKIYLHVPENQSKGIKLGQSRIQILTQEYPNNTIDPLVGETLQGYLIDNSHKLRRSSSYSMDGFYFKYYPRENYSLGTYTGLRYSNIFQTPRFRGFYVYTYHNGRKYTNCWDTFVELRDKIDLSPYSDIVLSYYLVESSVTNKAQSRTIYAYTVHCAIYLYYNDESTGREKYIRLDNGLDQGEALFDAAIGWEDNYSGSYNWGGQPVVGSETIKIYKIPSRKYRIKFHFYNINDLGNSKVDADFRERCVITGIKLIPGQRIYVNLDNLYGYDSCKKTGSSTNRTYEYSDMITVNNGALYVNQNNDVSNYNTLSWCKYYEGYNGKLDPFVIFKYGNEYYLDVTVKNNEVTVKSRFIPSKVGKLYKVVEVVRYLYNKTSYKDYYTTYNCIDFYVCTGYNSLSKIEKLYRNPANPANGKIYSEIKGSFNRRGELESLDFDNSILANGSLNKVYRVYNADMSMFRGYYIYNENAEGQREHLLYHSRALSYNFYGYMKCTGTRTFSYVNGWDYPIPEDNPVAARVYNIGY